MIKKKVKIGYATGVFDLFHVGHLRLLEKARLNCDYLIVGVTTDDLVFEIKDKYPIIPFDERVEIVSALRCVDRVVPEANLDKLAAWKGLHFDITFKGSDWKGTSKWIALEERFYALGVEVMYFPYTEHTSSTKLSALIDALLDENTHG